jgi:hypothetical protein
VSEPPVLAPPAPPPIASALRSAAFRAGLFGGVLFLGIVLFLGMGTFVMGAPPSGASTLRFWLQIALSAFVVGLTAFPIAFVEGWAVRRAQGRPWRWGFLAGALAFVGGFLAVVQVVYTRSVTESGSFEGGAESVSRFLAEVRRDPSILALFGMLAAPFVPATVGRIRALPLRPLVVMTAFWGTILALPCWVVVFQKLHGSDGALGAAWGIALLVIYALLPVVLHVADGLERRVGSWLSRREP